MKLSFEWKVLGFDGSSPSREQNPPKGIRLRVYSVPDLSVPNLQALGGSQIQNSFTFTPVFLAARKCPSSWRTTSVINIRIQIMIIRIHIY